MNARLLFTHALSPLHAGTGQGVGVIDLPIAREKATGIPYLPGSSIKGVLRDSCLNKCKNGQDKEKSFRVFGPDKGNADEYAGSAQFSDQKLLLLPIRSLAGTFAWATSPYLLRRFQRDAKEASITAFNELSVPTVDGDKCLIVKTVDQQVQCRLKLLVGGANKVVLEDLDLTPTEDAQATAWAELIGNYVFAGEAEWQPILRERFCIVPDDVLSFLLDTATEITARIKLLEEAKTVEKGGLWYEEALPTETILYGLVLAVPTKNTGLNNNEVFNVVAGSIDKVVQLGGKATVGRGLCRLLFQSAQAQPNLKTPQPSSTTSPSSSPSSPSPASGESSSKPSAPPAQSSTLKTFTIKTLGTNKPSS